MHGRQNTSVSGDYIYNSKEVKKSYIVTGSQNCRYCMWLIVAGVKDVGIIRNMAIKSEQVYETITTGVNVSRVKFSNMVSKGLIDVEYSYGCRGVEMFLAVMD